VIISAILAIFHLPVNLLLNEFTHFSVPTACFNLRLAFPGVIVEMPSERELMPVLEQTLHRIGFDAFQFAGTFPIGFVFLLEPIICRFSRAQGFVMISVNVFPGLSCIVQIALGWPTITLGHASNSSKMISPLAYPVSLDFLDGGQSLRLLVPCSRT
jgi:hypothetical protein